MMLGRLYLKNFRVVSGRFRSTKPWRMVSTNLKGGLRSKSGCSRGLFTPRTSRWRLTKKVKKLTVVESIWLKFHRILLSMLNFSSHCWSIYSADFVKNQDFWWCRTCLRISGPVDGGLTSGINALREKYLAGPYGLSLHCSSQLIHCLLQLIDSFYQLSCAPFHVSVMCKIAS